MNRSLRPICKSYLVTVSLGAEVHFKVILNSVVMPSSGETSNGGGKIVLKFQAEVQRLVSLVL